MSALPGGRQYSVIPCGMLVPVAVWQPCELLYTCYCYKGAIKGLVALIAGEMNWTEDDTVNTTMTGISNITFIKRRHACRTEMLKNGDGRTDGLTRLLFTSPPVGQTGQGGSSSLTSRRLTMNPLNEN